MNLATCSPRAKSSWPSGDWLPIIITTESSGGASKPTVISRMRNQLVLCTAAASLLSATALIAQTKQTSQPQVGRAPTADEVKQADITVLPNGAGLPEGSGTPEQGEA